jgi:hypothetical protein
MVYLLFLFSPKQTIMQARTCIQRELATLKTSSARQKALAALHIDALNLLAEVGEMPPHGGLVVTENVCFDTHVPITAFEYMYDDSGINATIKERIAYYYNTTTTTQTTTTKTTTTTTSTTKIVAVS